jgi:hypothetical protein
MLIRNSKLQKVLANTLGVTTNRGNAVISAEIYQSARVEAIDGSVDGRLTVVNSRSSEFAEVVLRSTHG